jgi:hypothetical protein
MSSGDPNSDPLPNSLFDLQNFQTLVTLGQATANILTDPTLVYGVDFDLTDDWYFLTSRLELNSVQQTYLIWLWIDTAFNQTFSRVMDGGNAQVGAISGRGSQTLKDTMNTMMIELPMFTWAS